MGTRPSRDSVHWWICNNWCYSYIRYSIIIIPVVDFMFILNMISAMCSNPFYVLHILSDYMRDPPTSDTKMCCSEFLIAGTNVRTCLENGEWELETFTMKSEDGLLNYSYCK